MTLTGFQTFAVVDTIKSTLSTNWNNANTDSRTPQFEELQDSIMPKAVGKDYVIVDYDEEFDDVAGSYGLQRRHEVPIVIDVKTTFKPTSSTIKQHGENMVKEVGRIFDNNPRINDWLTSHVRVRQIEKERRDSRRFMVYLTVSVFEQ